MPKRILIGLVIAYISIAWSQALEEGKRAFDAGNYDLAARKFQQAYEASHRCEVLFYMGMARYRAQHRDEALIAFQSATQCDPKMAMAHLALGEAYAEKGNSGEALLAFNRVLAIEPHNPDALREASAVYLKQGDNAKAADLLKTLIRLEPDNPDAHAELAAALYGTGDPDAAAVSGLRRAARGRGRVCLPGAPHARLPALRDGLASGARAHRGRSVSSRL